jgi:hypothetical protein
MAIETCRGLITRYVVTGHIQLQAITSYLVTGPQRVNGVDGA